MCKKIIFQRTSSCYYLLLSFGFYSLIYSHLLLMILYYQLEQIGLDNRYWYFYTNWSTLHNRGFKTTSSWPSNFTKLFPGYLCKYMGILIFQETITSSIYLGGFCVLISTIISISASKTSQAKI